MCGDLPIELVAQYNHVLKLIGDRILLRISGIPDLRFAEKAEAQAVNHLGRSSQHIGTEEDGRSEDPFEGRHQSPVLFAALCIPNVSSISEAVRKRIV
jgi:hypothetical protein